MNLKMLVAIVAGLFLSMGCTTMGTDIHQLGDGYGYRVSNVGNANMLEPTFQYTMLEKCEVMVDEELYTYVTEDEMMLEETVTETREIVTAENCQPVRVDHVSSPGFLPGLVGTVMQAAGTAAAGYFVGDGIGDAAADTTNVTQSADNSASGNAIQAQGQGQKATGGKAYQSQGQGQGQLQGQGQHQNQGQSSYNSNSNSNYNSNYNRNNNRNYNNNYNLNYDD